MQCQGLGDALCRLHKGQKTQGDLRQCVMNERLLHSWEERTGTGAFTCPSTKLAFDITK